MNADHESENESPQLQSITFIEINRYILIYANRKYVNEVNEVDFSVSLVACAYRERKKKFIEFQPCVEIRINF